MKQKNIPVRRRVSLVFACLFLLTALAGCSAKPPKALPLAGSPAQQSELYVKPVAGLADDFMRGADVSSYLAQKQSGVVYKDFDGNPLSDEGFFKLLQQSGINWVRIRVWNDPKDADGNSYGGGNNDLDTAVQIGKYATAAGLRVFIDFHYSDFWADPAKQMAPKDWARDLFEEKCTKLGSFTKDCLQTLLDAGVDVGMVQVGNETNNGVAGEKAADRVSRLLSTGCTAVRSIAEQNKKEILVAVHYTDINADGFADICGELVGAGVDFDVFAASYYPFWHGSTENLTATLATVASRYNKQVLVAETSYLYTPTDGDGFANSVSSNTAGVELPYEISVQGQANALRQTIDAVAAVGPAGLGVFYWEPAWLPVGIYDPAAENADKLLAENTEKWQKFGSGWASSYAASYDKKDAGRYYGGSSWDNQALFAFDGTPLESLRVFRYVYGGTTAPLAIAQVPDMAWDTGVNAPVSLPEAAPALLNSGEIKELPVVWNADETAAAEQAGAGQYVICGTATDPATKTGYPVACELHIKNINTIQNPGLEGEDVSCWHIEGQGVGRKADNNKRTGEHSLHFWSAEKVEYTVTQTLHAIAPGSYDFSVWLQGGDAGENAKFEAFVLVNETEYTAQIAVTSWQNWAEAAINGIPVAENAQVTVGVRASADAGAWGAWDDFSLTLTGE